MSRKRTSNKAHSFETPNGHEHFTRIYDSMLESAAYKSLGHAARTVYIILKKQYKGDYTGNKVTCPYSVFKTYGMNSTTVSRALTELQEKGFIEVSGGTFVTGNLRREPNEYKFSSKWLNWREPP